MFRLAGFQNLHNQVRSIATKAIERPRSHAFYDDKITTVI